VTSPHLGARYGPLEHMKQRAFVTTMTDWATYVVVRVGICIVQSLPRSFLERQARKWSYFLAYRVNIRRDVVQDNLEQSFPEWTEEECQEVGRAMWEHLFLMVVEIAHAPRVIRQTTWRRHLRVEGLEQLIRTLWLDRPKVVLSGHHGNFELAAFLFGVFGFKLFSVARELDNPFLDQFVTEFRESRGQKILPKKGSAPDVAAVLEENGAIGLLGDQAAGRKGCRVDFFERPASVHKAIGVFALSSEAPVIVCTATRRDGLFSFDLCVEGVMDPRDNGPEVQGLTELSQWYTDLLEGAIRRRPDQYWWVHRRWRCFPQPPKKLRSGEERSVA
jgi:KDO2-lipid IV(A) lauroyltransferase